MEPIPYQRYLLAVPDPSDVADAVYGALLDAFVVLYSNCH